MTQLTGMENKAALIRASMEVREKVRELQNLLNTSTHMARQLVVTKDIEKLMRAQEKVHAGLQELVL
jgi:predicted RNA-binding Zn ribbon-like protein